MKKSTLHHKKNVLRPKGRNGISLRISPKKFRELAKFHGLDTRDYSIEELSSAVIDLLRSLEKLDRVDLNRVRLDPAFYPPVQRKYGR